MKGMKVLLFLALVAAARGQVEQCPAEQETNWEIELLLRHEDCNKFYKCTHGHPVEYTCYSNLYFNLETWQCDWPHNVDCTGRNDPALTTLAPPTPEPTTAQPTTQEPTTLEPTTREPTTPEPTTPEPTTPEPTTPEPTTPEPTTTTTTTTTTTPPPTTTTTTTTTTTPAPTTTTTTTTPAPTTTTTTTTPAPTTAASSSTHAPECEVEIWPQPETPAPEPEAPGTEAPEEEEVEVDFLQNGCPVDPHVHWLLPNEQDCNLFYYCVWGEKVLRECPPTLHFNPVLQVCDWPNAAGCAVSANKHAEARRNLLKQILL